MGAKQNVKLPDETFEKRATRSENLSRCRFCNMLLNKKICNNCKVEFVYQKP